MFVFICNWRVSSILPLTWARKRRYISRNVKLAKHVINPESGLFAFREASAPSCSAVCAQLLFRTVLLKHVLARRHVFWFAALNKNNAVIITDTNSPRFPRFKFRLSRSSPALFLTSLSCSPVLAFIYLPPVTRVHTSQLLLDLSNVRTHTSSRWFADVTFLWYRAAGQELLS